MALVDHHTPLAHDQLELETEHLILRPLTLSDADLALAIYTNEEVVRYVCDVSTPDRALELFKKNDTRRGAGGRLGIWSLTRKDAGEKIGSAVLLPIPVEKDDADWSLLVDEAYRRLQGLGFWWARQWHSCSRAIYRTKNHLD